MSTNKVSYITIAALALMVSGGIFPFAYNLFFLDENKIPYWAFLMHKQWDTICLLLFFVSFCLGIAALITKQVRKNKIWMSLCIINTIVCVFSIVSLLLLPPVHRGGRESVRQISCASNLRQTYLALQQYAADSGGYYPPENGAAGLKRLNDDYLIDYSLYCCPSTNTVKIREGQPLTENNLDYVYVGGLNTKSDPNLPLMYDKPDNHKYFGNVVYANGMVEGVYGEPWTKNLKKGF